MMNLPITPLTYSSGMKAAMVVADEPSTGRAICLAPSTQACTGSMPWAFRV